MIDTVVIVVSDRAARGERPDETAQALRPVLQAAGFALRTVEVVPDDRAQLGGLIAARADDHALVLTTGGTGVAPRDVTPEATRDVLDFEVPGLAEEMRRQSLAKTIHAVGSRAVAGVRGRALVVNLPGRPKGALECFGFVAKALPHLIALVQGPVEDDTHGAQDA